MVDDKRVTLIRPEDRAEGQTTPGIRREQAVTTDRSWAGYVTTEAGMVSGWHHHGDYATYIYWQAGRARMEFGPGGGDSCEAEAGDVVFVPRGAIHREANVGETENQALLVRVGSGEPVFNTDGPAS